MSLTITELGPFGLRLREALLPWMTPDLETVCAAIGAMGFNSLLELIEEEGTEGEPGWVPAWGKLGDPTRCPAGALGFLAGLVGVVLPVGCPEAEARALIKAESGRERGTRASVESAILRALNTPANLIPNPSFVYGVAGEAPLGWTAASTYRTDSGATLETEHPAGVQVEGRKGYCVVTTSGVTSAEGIDTGEVIPAIEGVPVTVYCWLWGTAGGEKVHLRLGSAEAGGETTTPITLTAGWKQYSVTFTPTGSGLMGFAVNTAGTFAYKWYIAGVATSAVYVDGDTEGYVWRGVKGDSVTGKTGSGEFELLARERANGESSPYYFTVLCHPQQLVPEGNTAQLDANVKGVKPAGLIPEYVLTEEPLQTDPYIDEFSRLIENIEGEIESLTLAGVT